MNIQPIEKVSKSTKLQVHSIFRTIQGEGPFSGHPAIFIRLAGCNLRCPSCDTDYTSKRSNLRVKEIINRVQDARKSGVTKLVVITGGEPFRQKIKNLVEELFNIGLTVQIETNGSLPPEPKFPAFAHIVCSPKTKTIHPEIYIRAIAFKYIINNSAPLTEKGTPTAVLGRCKSGIAKPRPGTPVYMQPEDPFPKNEAQYVRNVQRCRAVCSLYGHIFQLQVHKIIGVE